MICMFCRVSQPAPGWTCEMWNNKKMQQSLFLDFIAFIGEHLRNDNYCNPLDFNYWSYFSIPSPKKWETPWKTIVSEAQNPVKWSYPVGRTSFSCSSTSFSLLSLELGNCYPSGTPSPSNRLMGLSVSYLRNIYIYIYICVCGGPNYLIAMDMAKVGGPLSVVKVFIQIWTSQVHSQLLLVFREFCRLLIYT